MQAPSRLRIEDTTKCSPIARGLRFGSISGFAADMKSRAKLARIATIYTGFGAASPGLEKNGRSSQRVLRHLLLPSSPSMIFAATNAAEVNHNGDNQNQQIDASYRLSCIRHPRIH